MNKTTLVIDGDYLAYLVAFTVQTVSYSVVDSLSNTLTSLKNRTKCAEFLKEKKLNIEDFEIVKNVEVYHNWEQVATQVARGKIRKWVKAVGGKDYLIALGRTY